MDFTVTPLIISSLCYDCLFVMFVCLLCLHVRPRCWVSTGSLGQAGVTRTTLRQRTQPILSPSCSTHLQGEVCNVVHPIYSKGLRGPTADYHL